MRRGRLRLVGRWGVFVVTALVLVSIPVSVWVKPRIVLRYEKQDIHATRESWSTVLFDGRLIIGSHFKYGYYRNENGAGLPLDPKYLNPGWGFTYYYGARFQGKGSWWIPKRNDYSNGYVRRLELPLSWPVAFMCAWSSVLIWYPRRRRRLRAGCCVACGYLLAGLGEGVCPECGEGGD